MKRHPPCPRSRLRFRPRLRLRWLLPLALVLLPPLFWLLLLSLAPTDWARQRFAARLSEVTGRSVRLAGVRVGFLGGIVLTGLEIGAPGAVGDPWLKVAQASLNISPLQLVCGQVAQTETQVQGITLRVLRREDGSLELDDLIRGRTTASGSGSAAPEAGACSCPLSRLDLRIRDAEVTVIDAPTRTRLEFHEVSGHAMSEGRSATVHELRGRLSGGSFEVAAQLDRSTPVPSFEGHLRMQGIELDEGMTALGYLVPLLSSPTGGLDGTLDLNLYLRGRGDTRSALRKTVVGNGTVNLDPIRLEQSRLLSELAAVIELPPQRRIGAITSDFVIKQGKIVSDNLTVNLTKLPIVLTGWTDFDGTINYRLRSESLLERLPSRARDFLADLSIDAKDLSTLKIEGAVDAPELIVDGMPLSQTLGGRGEAAPAPGDDRPRLRELGRRLRDRILR